MQKRITFKEISLKKTVSNNTQCFNIAEEWDEISAKIMVNENYVE